MVARYQPNFTMNWNMRAIQNPPDVLRAEFVVAIVEIRVIEDVDHIGSKHQSWVANVLLCM